MDPRRQSVFWGILQRTRQVCKIARKPIYKTCFTGILVQLGDAGSAMATLVRLAAFLTSDQPNLALSFEAIAIHTFVVVMWGTHKHPNIIAYITCGLTWLFLAIFIATSLKVSATDDFYTPLGVSIYSSCAPSRFRIYHVFQQYWCWIGNRHKASQYMGQYVWIFIAMLVSF